MTYIIDLHCHILPNCDDGSNNMKDSLKLAQEEVDQGVSDVLLTPHHMDSQYVNHKEDVIKRVKQFQDELNQHHIPLNVYPGQEVHLTGKLIQSIDNDDILYADKNHHYLMLELPSYGIPDYFDQMRFDLNSRGITPIIVHPERNFGFRRNPNKLYQLVRDGCLTQITTSSYLGHFGKEIKRFTDKIINSNLGYTFSSDAHGLNHRRITIQSAYYELSKRNSELSNKYKDNAYHILLGNRVNNNSIRKISKDNKFTSFIKNIF